MKMTITEWINNSFAPGSRPHYNTVLQWVEKNLVRHERIGRTIYILAGAPAANDDADIAHIANRL